MAFTRTMRVQSNHTVFVKAIERQQLPKNLENKKDYDTFYAVKNFDDKGVTFMYLGKGHKDSPNEIVVWYPNGKMWSSFGKDIKSAIEGAQRDGWLYATNE